MKHPANRTLEIAFVKVLFIFPPTSWRGVRAYQQSHDWRMRPSCRSHSEHTIDCYLYRKLQLPSLNPLAEGFLIIYITIVSYFYIKVKNYFYLDSKANLAPWLFFLFFTIEVIHDLLGSIESRRSKARSVWECDKTTSISFSNYNRNNKRFFHFSLPI